MLFESQIKPIVRFTGSRLTHTLKIRMFIGTCLQNQERTEEAVLSWGEIGLSTERCSLSKSSVNPRESSKAGMTFESFPKWNEELGLLYWQNNQSLDASGRAALFGQGRSPERTES